MTGRAPRVGRTTPRVGRTTMYVAVATAAALAVATPPVAAQDDATLLDALGIAGVDATSAARLVAESVADAADDTFRYVVPDSRPATLTERYVDIRRAGAVEASWAGTAPTIPCGRHDDALVVCAGDPPDLNEPHALLWLQTGDDLPRNPELSASLAFAVLTDDGAPWVPQGPFQWDTFQGTDRWHDLGIRPDTDWTVVVQRFSGEDVIVEQTDTFAVILGDTFLMGVPLHELEPLEEGVGSHAAPAGRGQGVAVSNVALNSPRAEVGAHPWRWAAAVHFHDGTFGSAPSDTSGIDSHPDSDTATPRGPDRLLPPTSAPIEVAAGAPLAGDQPASSGATNSEGGTGAAWLVIGGVAVMAAVTSVVVARRRRAAAG